MPTFCVLLFAATLAPAATPLRLLRQFDFEERSRGNAEDVPMDWMKVEGPNFPHYVNATLATDQASGGRYAFRFDLDGGSVAYRYPAGRITIHPHAHYAVSVQARTQDLVNARAQLTAYCADARGDPIRSTVTRSEPLRDTPDGWTPLQIEVTAPDTAASLVLELALLQPSLWQRLPADHTAIAEQDITGHVWFDDLTVRQVPQVRLACDTPGHLFRHADPIALTVRLNDRLTDDLVGRLVVVDAEGRRVFQRTGAFDLMPAGDMDRGTRVTIPDLPAGWYRAELGFESDGISVGRSSVDFVRLADDDATPSPDGRFGVVATHLPFAQWDELPDVLPVLGVSRVKLAVWSGAGDAEHVPGFDFDRLLNRLAARQVRTTGCFTGVPPPIAAAVGGSDLRRLVQAKPEAW